MNLISTLLHPEGCDESSAAAIANIASISTNALSQRIGIMDQDNEPDEVLDDDKPSTEVTDEHTASSEIISSSTPVILGQLENVKQDLGVIKKYVDWVTLHAEKKSVGACAKYVRIALNSAGIKTPNNPRDANGYIDYLPLIGFSRYDLELTEPVRVGDIEVLPKVGSHKYGHIQIYNGNNWISDFKQKSEFPSAQYLEDVKKRGKRIIFRLLPNT